MKYIAHSYFPKRNHALGSTSIILSKDPMSTRNHRISLGNPECTTIDMCPETELPLELAISSQCMASRSDQDCQNVLSRSKLQPPQNDRNEW